MVTNEKHQNKQDLRTPVESDHCNPIAG